MPSGKAHRRDADLGNYDPMVNTFIDHPVRTLGPRHRTLFHTPETAIPIGFAIDGVNGAIGAYRHLILDGIKDKGVKAAIEIMASQWEKNKKRGPSFKVIMDWSTFRKEGRKITKTPTPFLKEGRILKPKPVKKYKKGQVISITTKPHIEPTTKQLIESLVNYIYLTFKQ